MKRYITSVFLLITMFAVVQNDAGSAKTDQNQRTKTSWISKLKIRESFNDDESIQNPAVVSVTLPKNKDASYLINLGLGYALPRKDLKGLRTGFLVAEYHRMNLSDNEIDNFQAGYKHQWIFSEPAAILPTNNNTIDNYTTFRLNSTLKYRRDRIEGSHGIAATFMLTFFRQGSGFKTWFGSTKASPSRRFHYTLSPEAGMEVQNNFKADSTIYKGFVGRPAARLAFEFGQSRPDPDDKFSAVSIWTFSVDLAARYDLLGHHYTTERFHPLIRSGLDFFILYKPIKLTLGGSYTYGQNPIQGFREFNFKSQHFALIAFKVQK